MYLSKFFFTFLLLAMTLVTKAQIVHIPDFTFKNILLSNTAINSNGDDEIQLTEALSVTSLSVSAVYDEELELIGTPHDLTGIEQFANLETLKINQDVQVQTLDLSGLANLQSLYMDNKTTVRLTLNGCTALDTLLLQVPIPGGGPDWNTSMTSLDLSDCISLRFLSCAGYVNLDTINLQNCINLEKLSLAYVRYDLINFQALTKLEEIVYSEGGTIDLDLRSFPKLRKLDAAAITDVHGFNISNNINLEFFRLYPYNSSQPDLDTADFSHCTKLNYLSIGNITSLKYLNIKNGNTISAPGQPELGSLPNLNRVCADEREVAYIFNILTQLGNAVQVSTYCSFTPGGAYNTVSGNIRTDLNNNGCDSADNGLNNVSIKLADNTGQRYLTSSDVRGSYNLYTDSGHFTLTPYLPYPYYTVTPSLVTIHFDTANNLTNTADFCLQPNGTYNDLEITFLPTFPPARPGFNASYTLLYKNRGTTTLSGNVAVNFDNNKMNFVSASENVTTQSSGQLLWNYSNLLPFESRTINVTFNLLPPPVNNIGDTINYLAVITPSDNDETAFDNIFILPQRVIGSFDPNDKQCIEGSNLDISKIGDYLHYQIRFQNEGTDTAFNNVVADTLSDNLDWNTFEYIGSSHTTDVKLTNNKLEFFFANISLPYKAIDEPGSIGWVAFKIKPKPSVVIGDSLNNRAAIYFDFNLPVITNTATTIVSSAATPVPVKLEYFSVNKKETANQLNWKASCTYGNAAFVIERSDDGIHFKSIGNITATSLRCQLPFNFMDNNPAVGKNYYRLKISDSDGKSFYSKTLVVGNNKSGIEIRAVANNVVFLNSNKQQTITMKVIATDGREVLNQKQNVTVGNNNIILQMKNAARGIYNLVVYTEKGDTITKKIVN